MGSSAAAPKALSSRTDQDIFSTGYVAALCGVAARTVSKWVDAGLLPAYRLPNMLAIRTRGEDDGLGDRRVKRADLIAFLRDRDFPVPPQLRAELTAVAVGIPGPPIPGAVSATPLGAGILISRGECSRVLIGCLAGLDNAVRVAEEVRLYAPGLPVALVLSDDRREEDLPVGGLFSAVLRESEPAAVAAWAAGGES